MRASGCLNKIEASVRDSIYVVVSAGTEGCVDELASLSVDCGRLGLSLLLWHMSGLDKVCGHSLKVRAMQESLGHAGLPCVWIDSSDDLLKAPDLTVSQFSGADVAVADNPGPETGRKSPKLASFFAVSRESDGSRRFLEQCLRYAEAQAAASSRPNSHAHDPMYRAYRQLTDERARLRRCVFLNATQSFRGCVRLNPSAVSSREVSVVS